MIVRHLADGRDLLDMEAILTMYDQATRPTVRRHCSPVDYDPSTHRALYDAALVAAVLGQVEPRPERVGKTLARKVRSA